jgi:hypothetical protein
VEGALAPRETKEICVMVAPDFRRGATLFVRAFEKAIPFFQQASDLPFARGMD